MVCGVRVYFDGGGAVYFCQNQTLITWLPSLAICLSWQNTRGCCKPKKFWDTPIRFSCIAFLYNYQAIFLDFTPRRFF